MKFVKLDISGNKLTRQEFINQPRKLFVLPDNLPDFRLPRNELHNTNNRGGLAAVMRPYLVGKKHNLPIYDVNIVGVPTVSFDADEPLEVKHIQEAFVGIYRLLKGNDFDEIVVPFKNRQPAFGGGVAGKLAPKIQKEINEQFELLEKFLSTKKINLKMLDAKFQQAYLEGPLPLATQSQSAIAKFLNKPHPWIALASKVLLGLTLGAGLSYALMATALLPFTPIGIAINIAAGLAVALATVYAFGFKGLFGEHKATFTIKGSKGWTLKNYIESSSVLRLFGFNYPYKLTLQELENDVKAQLIEQLSKAKAELTSEQELEISGLTKYYTKAIINAHAEYFYEEDQDMVNADEYKTKPIFNKVKPKSS
jgi:hypothetical protein